MCPDAPTPETLLRWARRFPHYRRQLARLFRLHVPPEASVLEVGVQLDDLLAAFSPSRGVGIAATQAIADTAQARYPRLAFLHADPMNFDLGGETFDFVIVSTVLGMIPDVQSVLNSVRRACRPDTRLIIAHYNAAWEPALRLATRLGLRRATGEQNWLSLQDLENLLYLADFEVIRKSSEVLLPLELPLLSALFNRLLVHLWPFTHFGLVELLVAKPLGPPALAAQPSSAWSRALPAGLDRPKVTVVVPTRNERGNIEAVVERTPSLGGGTELIFVDGNSTDGTADEIRRQIQHRPDRDIKLILQGEGTGKGDAVRKGFTAATGDVLMILDADLTVPPESLPRFLDALVQGKGELINGTRLVYPMQEQAMRFLNKVGNRFFSGLFSWLLDQPIRDTLCGTKALSRASYELIARHRGFFGDFDPFGDFDLLLGAAKANLKIIDVPIRYQARRYGETNIRRFRHGWLLLKMSWFAFRRLKLR